MLGHWQGAWGCLMKRLLAMIAAVGLHCAPAWSQVHPDTPALSMSWIEINQPLDSCLQRAERAMQTLGLQIYSRLSVSVLSYPRNLPFNLMIRCEPEKRMALLVCATKGAGSGGPGLEGCNLYLERLRAAW